VIRLGAIGVSVVLAGCSGASARSLNPAQVVVRPSAWPSPEVLPPDAAPHILSVWMNSTNVEPGKAWVGRIVTSTNVASVEVRTESFSFTADRRKFGIFDFSQDVLDVVPQYRRPYVLRLIARNTRGDSDERQVAITIR
jgi:hypothetical protein